MMHLTPTYTVYYTVLLSLYSEDDEDCVVPQNPSSTH